MHSVRAEGCGCQTAAAEAVQQEEEGKQRKKHERKTPPSCNLIEEELSERENYCDCRSAVREDLPPQPPLQLAIMLPFRKQDEDVCVCVCENVQNNRRSPKQRAEVWREKEVFLPLSFSHLSFPATRWTKRIRSKGYLCLLTLAHTHTFTHSLTASSGERNGVAVHLFPSQIASIRKKRGNSFRSSIPSFPFSGTIFSHHLSPALPLSFPAPLLLTVNEELLVISLVIA